MQRLREIAIAPHISRRVLPLAALGGQFFLRDTKCRCCHLYVNELSRWLPCHHCHFFFFFKLGTERFLSSAVSSPSYSREKNI